MTMMKKTPRYYQIEAYKALTEAATTPYPSSNGFHIPYANMATGTGKSLVAAMFTDKVLRQGGRVLQLVPTKELCEQNYEEAWHYVSQPEKLGICCAKLHRFKIHKSAVIATSTSFLRRAAESGAFNLCIIDECHAVSAKLDATYWKIITVLLYANPGMKIIGLSATPYRMGQGYLHNPCIEGKPLFTMQAYETDIPRLIKEGYLSHVESISGDVEADLTGVQMSGKDYNTDQMGVRFDAIVEDAVTDIRVKFDAYNINTALIFASTLANARHILEEWGDNTIPSGDEMRIAHGEMSNNERNDIIKWLKEGCGKRYIVNVGLYTTGFDFRQLDCVILMRATTSLGLYVQMCGRVIRAHEEKERGYVLDYGSNIERHGPIDATIPPKAKTKKAAAPKKICTLVLDENVLFENEWYMKGEFCDYQNHLSAKYCKKCGGEFISSQPEDGHYSMRSKAQILSDKINAMTEEFEVAGVVWTKAYSQKASVQMLKGLFYDEYGELKYTHYVCLDHQGYAKKKADEFILSIFKNEADYYELGQAGVNVENLYYLLNNEEQYFNRISRIKIRPQKDNTKFYELVDYDVEEIENVE